MGYDFEQFFEFYLSLVKDEKVKAKLVELKSHIGMFFTQTLRTPEDYKTWFGKMPWEETEVDNQDTSLCQ